MEQIISVSAVEESDAYGPVNLMKLMHKIDEGESKATYYDTAAGTQGWWEYET